MPSIECIYPKAILSGSGNSTPRHFTPSVGNSAFDRIVGLPIAVFALQAITRLHHEPWGFVS